ncbi:hypothetical protein HD806DRAFT_549023 [Xylariaceae sp. AK1471]|nr:hypothetical protein HD806DRAFT_549023 [Xylariaceae sp. AK1471]
MSTTPEIHLIPWDHTSEAHVARMVVQRKACGWGAGEVVSSWVGRADRGLKTMFWVDDGTCQYEKVKKLTYEQPQTLADSLLDREELLEAHRTRFPNEATPLKDTAKSLNLVPRVPSGAGFVPIGHVALNKNPAPDLEGHIDGLLREDGVYWITSLYISPATQHRGLGRAVMSHIENLVAQPPPGNARSPDKAEAALTGTVIALDAPPKEWHISAWTKEAFWDPMGLPMPKISNHEWYEQQGYTVFAELPAHRPTQLPNGGDTVNVPLLLLKKVLR